ncbi:LysR substrate-binding domain-containing protein [Sphingomonas sp. UYP23]
MSRLVTFDLEALRTFVTGNELGSFAKAADRLARSTSAVSAHLRKLEEQAGTPLMRKSGRGLVPTDSGEKLLSYARRLLDLNDEAAVAVTGARVEGWVRLAIQEDFGEAILPMVLGRFARAHPDVRIEARIARNAEIRERLAIGHLDLALVWTDERDRGNEGEGQLLVEVPMAWIGSSLNGYPRQEDPVPLVVMEGPCLFRASATAALDAAGIAWRIAFTSTSLAGIWAATSAGLGVTLRSAIGLPGELALVVGDALPNPSRGVGIRLLNASPGGGTPAVSLLSGIIASAVRENSARRTMG